MARTVTTHAPVASHWTRPRVVKSPRTTSLVPTPRPARVLPSPTPLRDRGYHYGSGYGGSYYKGGSHYHGGSYYRGYRSPQSIVRSPTPPRVVPAPTPRVRLGFVPQGSWSQRAYFGGYRGAPSRCR